MKPKIALNLIPGEGMLPIPLNSTREEAGLVLSRLGMPLSARDGPCDYYFENAIQIEFTDDRTSFIGISTHEQLAVFYHNENILGMEAEEAFRLIARHEGSGEHIYNCSEYLFPNQIITLWDADPQYDRPREEKAVWGAVGIGNAAYMSAIAEIKAIS